MYDLNLSVPNITSRKYSNDNRFLLLKNYLYELNETLSYALAEKTQSEISAITGQINTMEKIQQETATKLSSLNTLKFKELKEKILSTAEEIEKDCNSAIEQSEKQILQTVTSDFVSRSEFGEYSANTETAIKQN